MDTTELDRSYEWMHEQNWGWPPDAEVTVHEPEVLVS
jgi:hypothetical protein